MLNSLSFVSRVFENTLLKGNQDVARVPGSPRCSGIAVKALAEEVLRRLQMGSANP